MEGGGLGAKQVGSDEWPRAWGSSRAGNRNMDVTHRRCVGHPEGESRKGRKLGLSWMEQEVLGAETINSTHCKSQGAVHAGQSGDRQKESQRG